MGYFCSKQVILCEVLLNKFWMSREIIVTRIICFNFKLNCRKIFQTNKENAAN
jgi:hypothetical protein